MAIDKSKPHVITDGILDFLGSTESFSSQGTGKSIELDYSWDWKNDPIITPTIVNEWRYLENLLGKKVFQGASIVVSVGGGGTSQTHKYLDPNAREFYIVNPGIWDLQHAGKPDEKTETFLVRAIAEELPFKNNSVNAIEIPATLDHVVDPEEVLKECLRVLSPGGKIGVTLGNEKSWYRLFIRVLQVRFKDHHGHAHNFHFTPRETEELLKTIGFTNVTTVGTAYLKLPKVLERRMGGKGVLTLHSFVSNRVLPLIFGARRGGMFLTVGEKP